MTKEQRRFVQERKGEFSQNLIRQAITGISSLAVGSTGYSDFGV